MTDEPRTLRELYEELVLWPMIVRELKILVLLGLIPIAPEWKAERDEEKAILLGEDRDDR